ncbi:hypothetical protein [Archangium sp.]|uniref:hypothetical protein n=1 Tax=Archangium sp. TaxID=1872627 RepID=UPI00389ABF1D
MTAGSPRTWALAAASGFSGVALFQVALALGAPLGAAAWGGAERVLSPEHRVGSGVAALILCLSALIVCGRAGLLKRTPGWMRLFRAGTWVLAAQMALNTLANLASASPWERYLMSVLTLTLCVLCLGVTRSPVPPTGGGGR